MKHYLLYGHGGAYNHGSEAAVRCTVRLLRERSPGCRITLSSHFPEQDRQLGIDADEIVGRNPAGKTNEEIYAETIARITPETVCLSVGGDNYCYPNWQRYAAIHYAALERGAGSVLWSCSIEPSMLDGEMLAALRTHHLITVREDVSFDALRERGLDHIVRVSDIAFALEPEEAELPPQPYAALNLSPLVLRRNPALLDAYQRLTDEILNQTDWSIALVPHVEMPMDNDCEALSKLHGPPERMFRIRPGLTAAAYKHIIAHAELLVASRTHATIAAWSSGVPAVAVGYSAKARGVAADVGQEDWVLDAEALSGDALSATFWRLFAQKETARGVLAGHIQANRDSAVNVPLERFLKRRREE